MSSWGLCHKEEGQMIAELLVVIPTFILVLAITCATFMFLSESARIERIANEVAREISQGITDPIQGTAYIYDRAFARKYGTRLDAYVRAYNDPVSMNNSRRRCEVIIEFRPFTFALLKSKKVFVPIKIVKKKKFYTTIWSTSVMP